MTNNRVLVQTRIPATLRIYLKAYAKQHQTSLEETCETILKLFLDRAPWQQGLRWRNPLSHRTDDGESQGWAQFNVLFPAEIAAQLGAFTRQPSIKSASDPHQIRTESASDPHQIRVSRAAVMYTGLFWFAKFISPPVTPK